MLNNSGFRAVKEDGDINEIGLRVGRNAQVTFLQPMTGIQTIVIPEQKERAREHERERDGTHNFNEHFPHLNPLFF